MNETNNVSLTIKLEKNGICPKRALDGDAGYDVFAPEDIIIKARQDCLIPLQIRTAFPKGHALIMLEKSGIATKKKLSIGGKVIDSNYRGIIHAHIFSHNDKDVTIKCTEKIAQILLMPCITSGQPIIVEELKLDTNRQDKGFGSTGK